MGELEAAGRSNVVVLCTDARFLLPCAFLIEQLARDPGRRCYDIAVVHQGVAETDLERLRTRSTPECLTIAASQHSALLNDLPISERVSRATYLRLRLHELLPARYERMLYLDCDIYLDRPHIAPLFGLDLAGAPFAACQDVLDALVHAPAARHSDRWVEEERARALAYKQGLSLGRDDPYFNSGVMLIDRRAWAASGLTERALTYAASFPDRCTTAEQSALNAVAQGSWAELSPQFNFQWLHAVAKLDGIIEPTLRHFAGADKPWNSECWGARFTREYRAWHATSGWQGEFPAGPARVAVPQRRPRLLPAPLRYVVDRLHRGSRDRQRAAERAYRGNAVREAILAAMAGRSFIGLDAAANLALRNAIAGR